MKIAKEDRTKVVVLGVIAVLVVAFTIWNSVRSLRHNQALLEQQEQQSHVVAAPQTGPAAPDGLQALLTAPAPPQRDVFRPLVAPSHGPGSAPAPAATTPATTRGQIGVAAGPSSGAPGALPPLDLPDFRNAAGYSGQAALRLVGVTRGSPQDWAMFRRGDVRYLVTLNQNVEGYRVTSIRKNSVTLSAGGKSYTLTAGEK